MNIVDDMPLKVGQILDVANIVLNDLIYRFRLPGGCLYNRFIGQQGMERKRETEHNDLLPKKGNPLNETVCYKIGGTVFEIETTCGGSELLYDKMTRLIKAETVETPADKKSKERYNSDSNLFVGRSLQEE